jgi:CRP-like cAMP-binding protein
MSSRTSPPAPCGTYKKGALIFGQGDPIESLFVLLEGLVKVVVGSEWGEEMVLVTLEPRPPSESSA